MIISVVSLMSSAILAIKTVIQVDSMPSEEAIATLKKMNLTVEKRDGKNVMMIEIGKEKIEYKTIRSYSMDELLLLAEQIGFDNNESSDDQDNNISNESKRSVIGRESENVS